ncbi:EAL domain-containing protein [Kerstersia similis]|uniref:EAL domain-containing protein n=1 Tax=Kerstersia similis TaxID=206505 RepID=UPI0039EEB6E2
MEKEEDFGTCDERLPLALFEEAAVAMVFMDRASRVYFFNRASERLWGYGRSEVLGRDAGFLLPASLRCSSPLLGGLSPAECDHEQAEAICSAQGRDVRVVRKDGSHVGAVMALVQLGDGGSLLVGLCRGVQCEEVRLEPWKKLEGGDGCQLWSPHEQARQAQEQKIRELERDMLAALTSGMSFEELGRYLCQQVHGIAPEVLPSLMTVDLEAGTLQEWYMGFLPDAYVSAIVGQGVGEGVGSCGTAAARGVRVPAYDIATDPLWNNFRAVALAHGLHACWSYPIKRRDGSVAATFSFYSRDARWPSALHERIISACVHLCALAVEREESRQQMARLVQSDALTGLPNRGRLHDYVDALLRRSPEQEMGFFCLDIDRLQDINATLGHVAGDHALVQLANALQQVLKSGEFLCRAEGDLFVIVIPGCTIRHAAVMAERLLAAVRVPVNLGGHQLSMSASIGISHYPDGKLDRDTLFNNAKNAMYRAKQSGGDAYQFFSPEMNQLARSRLLLGAALKRAIANNALTLAYQPQVYTANGQLHCMEALARWHDPKLGEIPPGRFINLAEEIGQIDAIGAWALREACRQLAQWRSDGLKVPAVAVNLSPFNFRNRELPAMLADLLREYDLQGTDLTIEITESAMMAMTPEMQDLLHRVRQLGIGLSVDDFGTGFSSLSNLVNLPVTEVKIDRSFINKSQEDPRLQALVAAVIGIGRSLGLAVVAEGVETRGQCELLVAYRCPISQGYLFSRPLPAAEVPAWLKQLEGDSGFVFQRCQGGD